ncbi:MAG TPA: hypothetical protein VFV17_01965, partial [Usitatibacteraceae bacterium]|nr:hypothetical protein [Usitatibacteraceae bacterium]
MLRKFLLAACAAMGIVSMPAHTQAQAGKLTVEDIWKSPTMASLNISPSGKYLAATTPIRGRMNLTIVDLEARTANGITGYTDFDVQGINWIGDDRLVYSLGQNNSPTGAGRFDGGGLFVINRDGKDLKRLSTTVRESRARGDYVFRGLRFARRIPGNTNEIIAAGNMVDAVSTDLYRLDLNTGKYTLITRGRPADRTGNWIMDRKLTPRVVTASVKDTLISVVYYRDGEDSPWVEIARNDAANKGNVFVPLSIEADDKTLQVASNHASDTMAIYRFDPVAKKFGEKIAAHPRYDMGATLQGERIGGVVTDPDTDRLLGYSVNAGKPEVVWLDKDYAATQAALDGALPNAINSFRRLPGGSKRMLVTSYSDTKPVRWYIFDEAAKTLERIGISRPWLEGKLTEQRIMSFKTRDGLDIAGYYFLPKDYKPGTKLPTVVHIHGGPFARADYWGSGFGYNEGQ